MWHKIQLDYFPTLQVYVFLVRAVEYGEHIEHFANSEDKALEGWTVTVGAEVHLRAKPMTEL